MADILRSSSLIVTFNIDLFVGLRAAFIVVPVARALSSKGGQEAVGS